MARAEGTTVNYTVQFQTQPDQTREEVLVVRAECVPRVGEQVELDGESFIVLAVFHSAGSIDFSVEMPPPKMYDASTERIIVRVQ
jgi:hypothetical protein